MQSPDSCPVPGRQRCHPPAETACHRLQHQLASHPRQASHSLTFIAGNKKADGFWEAICKCLIETDALTPLHMGTDWRSKEKNCFAPSSTTVLTVTDNWNLEVNKKCLRVWRTWRLFPVFHGVSFSHRRRCSPVRAAGKVSSPRFRSTRAGSQQQHKKEKVLTGTHADLSTWFYKVTGCKHLPKYTAPPLVRTRTVGCFRGQASEEELWCYWHHETEGREGNHTHVLHVEVFLFDTSPA